MYYHGNDSCSSNHRIRVGTTIFFNCFNFCTKVHHHCLIIFAYLKVFVYTPIAIGKPIDDHHKVFNLLKGLGQAYEFLVTSMLKSPIPSYSRLVPLFQRHGGMEDLINTQEFNHNVAFVGQQIRGPAKLGAQQPSRLMPFPPT